MKSLMTVLLLTTVLTVSGCGQQENKVPVVNLHIAALQGNITALQQHIKTGSDLNIKDEYGTTPLNAAITFGRTEAAKVLINAGADLNVKNNDGSSPLHVAAFFCRTDIVKELLKKGADKDAINNFGSTPLQTVTVPFEVVEEIYDSIGDALKTLGLNLDYDRIRKTRPVIAELLR